MRVRYMAPPPPRRGAPRAVRGCAWLAAAFAVLCAALAPRAARAHGEHSLAVLGLVHIVSDNLVRTGRAPRCAECAERLPWHCAGCMQRRHAVGLFLQAEHGAGDAVRLVLLPAGRRLVLLAGDVRNGAQPRDSRACVARLRGALTRALAAQRANNTAIYMSSQAWPWEITLGGAARAVQRNGSVRAAPAPAPAAAPRAPLGTHSAAPGCCAPAGRPASPVRLRRSAQSSASSPRAGSLSECAPFCAGAFDADPTKSPWATYNKGAFDWG